MFKVTLKGCDIVFSHPENIYLAAADAFIYALRKQYNDCTIFDDKDQIIFETEDDLEEFVSYLDEMQAEDRRNKLHVYPYQHEYISYALEMVNTNRGNRI